MSVESWARRASGLLVPTMGFANPLGRFQPCPDGDCCPPCFTCSDCYNGTIPGALWVDLPLWSNSLCPNCADFEQTIQVTRVIPDPFLGVCGWMGDVVGNCPSAGNTATVTVFLFSTFEQCRLQVELFSGFYTPNVLELWRHDNVNCSINEINHSVPWVGHTGAAMCDFSAEPPVLVYE